MNEMIIISINAVILIVIALIGFFFKRYMTENDAKLKKLDDNSLAQDKNIVKLQGDVKAASNDLDERRLNSHSKDIRELFEKVIRNEQKLENTIENGKEARDIFSELLDAKLKPIHEDLQALKNKK